MRRAAAVLLPVLLLVAVGCGGGEKRDPPATVVALVEAVEAGDSDEVDELLTRASHGRVDRASLARLLRPFFGDREFVLAEFADPPWALVVLQSAKSRPAAAFAATLIEEEGEWRVELGSPIDISPTAPAPGSQQREVLQVAAEVKAHAPIGSAALWLDSLALEAGGGGLTGKSATLFSRGELALAHGRHVVTAFARAGETAHAYAWAFTVRPR